MARRALSSFLPLNSCKGAVVQIHSFLPNSNPFILVQLKSIHFSPVQIHSFQSSSNPFISAQFKSTHFSPVQSIHFSPVQIHSFQSCSNPFISVQFRSSLRAPGRSTGRTNPRSLSPVQHGDYVRTYALMIPTPTPLMFI